MIIRGGGGGDPESAGEMAALILMRLAESLYCGRCSGNGPTMMGGGMVVEINKATLMLLTFY